MTGREKRVQIYVDESEYKHLKEWSNETDKSISQLGREAILEYVDHDRLDRVESQLQELSEHVERLADTLGEQDAHTHKSDTPMSDGPESLETAREIVRRLQENHDNPDGVVKNADVERAIEDHAGIDDRTIRKYKRLFRKRGLLLEHPGEPELWTTEDAQWLEWMQQFAQLNGYEETQRVAEEYPASVAYGTGGSITIELAEVDA